MRLLAEPVHAGTAGPLGADVKRTCTVCRYGVMTLEAGPGHPPMRAPCVVCSADKTLTELEDAIDSRMREIDLDNERDQIREHNARLGVLS
jgi:hypothetical protein